MIQYRGTDWGSALGSGIIKGIAIGNQYRQSKAQSDYSSAADAAKSKYDEAMKAAGDDKQAQLAAATARDTAMSEARQKFHTYLGDVDKADAAYREGQESAFADNYNLAGEHDPYANSPTRGMNVSQRFAYGMSLGQGGQPIMVASNGPVQGVIQAKQGMPTGASGNVQLAPQQAPQYDAKGAAAYLSELQAGFKKDPTAVNKALLQRINADPLRAENGITYDLAGNGQFQEYHYGKPAGNPQPIPSQMYQGMVNRYFKGEVEARYGKDPNVADIAAGGVGALDPTAPAADNGGEAQQGRPQAMITGDNVPQQETRENLLSRPRTRQNETVTTTRKIQAGQSQQAQNDGRPTAAQDLAEGLALLRQGRLPAEQDELIKYLEQNERKVDEYYNAYFRRFRRWPNGADRHRLLQIAQLKENGRHNRIAEANADVRLAEDMRKSRLAEEAARQTAMNMGSVKAEDKPEKFSLGEPDENGVQRVFGGNGLPTGYDAVTIESDGRNNPLVFAPSGMPKAKVAEVINFMTTNGFGNPVNTSYGTTEWRPRRGEDGNIHTISFLEAMQMAKESAAKAKADEVAKTQATKAKVRADRKARLARTKEDYALYKKDPQAFARVVAERKKAMNK